MSEREGESKLCMIVAETLSVLTLTIACHVLFNPQTSASDRQNQPQQRQGFLPLELFMTNKVCEPRGRAERIKTRLHTLR